MKASLLFTILISLVFCYNLNAQDPAQLDNAINEIQQKMQKLDPDFVPNLIEDNPSTEMLATSPELLSLVIEKSELFWQKHKLKPAIAFLVQTYKSFHSGINALEIAATEGSEASIKMVQENKVTIFEGCVRASLEGFGLTGNSRMLSDGLGFIDRYHLMNKVIATGGEFEIIPKEKIPNLIHYYQFLQDNQLSMVSYFEGVQAIYAVVAWNNGDTQLQVLDKTKVIEAIKRLQSSMIAIPSESERAQNYKEFTEASLLLNRLIFNHAWMSIPDSTQSIVIIPDGIINAVPFDLLLQTTNEESVSFAPDKLDYLINSHRIGYANSAYEMFSGEDAVDPESMKEKQAEKMALLSDPSSSHPYHWKSALLKDGEKSMLFCGTEAVAKQGRRNRMIFFAIGLLAAVGLFFFMIKAKN